MSSGCLGVRLMSVGAVLGLPWSQGILQTMGPNQGNADIGCSPYFMLGSSLLEFLPSLDALTLHLSAVMLCSLTAP